MSLEVKNLTLGVEHTTLVKDVSFTVPSEECHVIMGRNGSGKSTLAQALVGHPTYKVQGGKIFLQDQDITSLPPHDRARKGMFLSFQQPVAIPGVSWLNFLRESCNQIRQSQGQELLEGIEAITYVQDRAASLNISVDMLKRFVNAGFSGGEQKRMEMLQMLVLQPQCLILDEIDAGMDIEGLDLLHQTWVRVKPQVTLIITHSVAFAQRFAPQRVYIMEKGQLRTGGNAAWLETFQRQGFDHAE